MPIFVRNPSLEKRLDKLAQKQPVPTTRTQMLEAIGDLAAAACERTGNPEAWRQIGYDLAPPHSGRDSDSHPVSAVSSPAPSRPMTVREGATPQ